MKSAEATTTATNHRPPARSEEQQQPFFQREAAGNARVLNRLPFFPGNGSGSLQRQPFFKKTAIQRNLRIGASGDQFEQEADRISHRVVQCLTESKTDSEHAVSTARPALQCKAIFESEAAPEVQSKGLNGLSVRPSHLQRKCADCEREEKGQEIEESGKEEALESRPTFDGAPPPPEESGDESGRKSASDTNYGALQPKCSECAGKKGNELQRQETSDGATTAPGGLANELAWSRGGGSPLSEATRAQMEGAFGADFSNVRIHTDSSAEQMSRSVRARAFAHGNHIYFNSGQYDPGNIEGQRLLAHELTHTVQQGAAAPTKAATPIVKTNLVQTSPQAEPGLIDDVASYLLTGSDALDFIVGVVAGIFEWFGDLLSGIVSLVKQAFEGSIGAILAIIGIIIVIVLACAFPEVVVPILMVLGIIAGLVSMAYFIYMMTRPGLTPYQRGKFLGKAIVEAALLIFTVAEAVRLFKTLAEVAKLAEGVGLIQKLRWARALLKFGNVEKVLQVLGEVKDIEKTIEILGLVNDVDKTLELLKLGKNIDAMVDLLKSGMVTADKLLDILRVGKLADAAQAKRLLELGLLADADQLERLIRSAKVLDGAQLERLLGGAKVLDGAQLERLLGSAKVLDGAQLERLLGSAKVLDGAQLERLLGSVKVLDGAQLERLLGGAKVLDGAQLERLLGSIKVLDGAQLERLLGSAKVLDGAQLERLLVSAKLLDGAQLERLLGSAKVLDGAQLERLLGSAKVLDGAQLERLLGSAKVLDGTQLERLLASAKLLDGAQLERLLGSAKVLDGAQLERLLGSAKVLDGTQLERLLGSAKVLDGAQLERLLGSVKVLDGAQLERLLGLVDDGDRLERLLALADTGIQLEDFLTKAGGATQAANLEDLMRLAGPGRAARLIEAVNLAAGNAAKFQELTEWTKRLSLRSATVPPIAPPPEVATFGFGGANMTHFLDSHTWEFIDILKRLNNPNWPTTTFWPPTSPTTVQSALGDALRNLNPVGGPRLPVPGSPEVTHGGGFTVQVGSRSPPIPPIIGQFFPISQPGLVSMTRAELRAIWEILKP